LHTLLLMIDVLGWHIKIEASISEYCIIIKTWHDGNQFYVDNINVVCGLEIIELKPFNCADLSNTPSSQQGA